MSFIGLIYEDEEAARTPSQPSLRASIDKYVDIATKTTRILWHGTRNAKQWSIRVVVDIETGDGGGCAIEWLGCLAAAPEALV